MQWIRAVYGWVGQRWLPARPYVAAFLGLLLVIGLSIVERLEAALAAMHRVGDVAATFGGIATPASLWSAESAQARLRAWMDWDADRLAGDLAGTVMSARHAVGWFVLIDTLVVAVPAGLLLWLLGGWAREVIRNNALERLRTVAREHQASKLPHEQAVRLRHEGVVRARALCQISSSAGMVALGYVALDATENEIGFFLVSAATPPVSAVRVLGLVSLLKLILLAAAAVPLVLVGLAARHRVGRNARALGRQLAALRGQVIVVALVTASFVALGGDIGSQVDDVVMRWVEQPEHAVAAVTAAMMLTALVALTGFACHDNLLKPPVPGNKPLSARLLLSMGIGGMILAAGGLGLASLAHIPIGYPLVFPGVALALFAALSARKAVRAVKPPPPPLPDAGAQPGGGGSPAVLVWTLAAIPLAALGLVVLRCAVTLAVTRESFYGFGLLGIALILVAAAASAIHPGPWPAGRGQRIVQAGLSVVALGAAVYAAWKPLTAGDLWGTFALLQLLLIVVLLILTGLHWAADAVAPRGVLALVRLRRMPFIALAVCWFTVTSLIDRTTYYHDVRLGEALPHDFQAVTLDEAFTAWLDKQHRGPVVDGKERVPMVFIATAGGGIRSAYWTSLILDCLFAAQPTQPQCAGQPIDKSAVFAASGISGGSLGLAVDRALEDTGGRFSEVLDRDFLSPDVAALAFRDLPNYLLRLQPGDADRAAVMEHSWEQAMGTHPNPLSQGFFAASRNADGSPRFPLLLLNSATVDDGCRLNGSTLDASPRVESGPAPPTGTEGCLTLTPFEPGREDTDNHRQAETLAGSKDLFQHLCRPQDPPADPDARGAAQPIKYDIPLSAAAHLSARFPYISPTGALTSCTWPQRRTYALDGGLLEGSAVSPLTEIWARLSSRIHEINTDPAGTRCIEPRLLMIDNGYVTTASTNDGGRPPELIAPATGLSRFSGSWGARAEQAAALAFDHAIGAVACRGPGGKPLAPQSVHSRIAHFVPTAHPGPRAPLGWSLSRYARRDLTTQARSPANLCQVALVRSWLSDQVPPGGMRCVTGFAVRATAEEPGLIAMLAPPIQPTRIGVPGVRITAAPDAGPDCAHGTSTDATGRFQLLLPAGPPAHLTVCWAGTTVTVNVPSGNSPLVTSDNFTVVVTPDNGPA